MMQQYVGNCYWRPDYADGDFRPEYVDAGYWEQGYCVEHNPCITPVGKPKYIWAKAKAKVANVEHTGEKQIIKAAKQQARQDAEFYSYIRTLEYSKILINQQRTPILADSEIVQMRADMAYREELNKAITAIIRQREIDDEESVIALLM